MGQRLRKLRNVIELRGLPVAVVQFAVAIEVVKDANAMFGDQCPGHRFKLVRRMERLLGRLRQIEASQ
jgi:hypothetical protein